MGREQARREIRVVVLAAGQGTRMQSERAKVLHEVCGLPMLGHAHRLAAQVGGIGIAPGANINYETGHGVFEATHGTAPKYAGLDKVNPCSVILSGVMMLDHMGWEDAARMIERGIARNIAEKRVTYDFERLMDGATKLSCSEFGSAVIDNMD